MRNFIKLASLPSIKKQLFVIPFMGLLLSSCGMMQNYMASYSVGLSSVESPANAKQQFGETKVVDFKDGEVNKYRYEDDYIEIVWFVSSKQFNFELKNKTTHSMKINWDDISFVDINGKEITGCKFDKVLYDEKQEEAYNFNNGYACVKKDGKWGIIDRTGKLIVKFLLLLL